MSASPGDLSPVLTHVFMPPHLPNKWTEADERTESNHSFFRFFQDFLNDPASLPESSREAVPSLLQALDSILQAPKADVIFKNLQNVKENPFWMYLGHSTCMLQIRSINGRLCVAGFDLYPSQDACAGDVQFVLKLKDDPIPLAAKVAMPRLTVWGCPQQIQQLAFARQLVDIKVTASLPGSVPQVNKAKSKVQETRQPNLPVHLFQWLIPFVALESMDDPPFFKKLRTESIFSSGQPWIRSIQWNGTRSLVQQCLRQHFSQDPNRALLEYKLLLLHFLAWLLERALKALPSSIVLHMSQKLAIRLRKLQTGWPDQIPSSHPAVALSNKICQAVRDHLETLWLQTQAAHSASIQIAPIKDLLDCKHEEDTRHVFTPENAAFLRSIVTHTHTGKEDKNYPPPPPPTCFAKVTPFVDPADLAAICQRLGDNLKNAPAFDKSRARPLATEQALYEIEASLKGELWPRRNEWKATESAVTSLDALCQRYLTEATSHYRHNPVLHGRIFLVLFTFTALIDALTIRWDTTGIIGSHQLPKLPLKVLVDEILLPTSSDLDWCSSVLDYLRSRSSEGAPGTIFDELGLPLAYFNACQMMKTRLSEVLKIQAAEEEEKRTEFKDQIDRYKQYQITLSRQTHCCYNSLYYCDACSTQRSLSSLSIRYYEKRLPEDSNDKKSVIFHQCIPPTMRCWRRSLLRTWLDCQPPLPQGNIANWWSSAPGSNDGDLGSSTKPLRQSHYSNPVSVSSITGSSPDILIINQGRKLSLALGNGVPFNDLTKGYDLKGKAHFHLHDARYRSLDWLMNPKTPYLAETVNQVIASQSDCHAKLDLNEFVEFGLVRGSGGLQLRHIVQAVIGRSTLSFHESSVVALLQQALYQPGPHDKTDPLPLWKHDLLDTVWVKFACDQLLQLATSVEKNWERYLTVQSILTVAGYLASFAVNAEARASAALVMRRCREIARGWIGRIAAAAVLPSPSQQDSQTLFSYLLGVTSVVVLSFDADKEDVVASLLDTTEDARVFIEALLGISDNVGNISLLVTPENTLLLTTIANTSRIALTHAGRLHHLIAQDSTILAKLVCSRRELSGTETIFPWQPYPSPADQWYFSAIDNATDGSRLPIQLNIASGALLISGAPVSRLPEAITTNQEFKRVFGTHIFQVYRDAQPDTFISQNTSGCVFKFHKKHPSTTGIIDITSDRNLHLLPTRIFSSEVPNEFVENYSHWFDPVRHQILFRPVGFANPAFLDSATNPHWIFQLESSSESSEVAGVLSSGPGFVGLPRRLVGIRSLTFQKLLTIFDRVEKRDAIHVLVISPQNDQELADPKATLQVCQVYLPLLDLTFGLQQDCTLEALNFPGMVVTENQTIGTLIGFWNYLHLSLRSNPTTGKIIVPVLSYHLKDVKYFDYDCLEDLKYLSGSTRSAKLFLAFLHTITAATLPDPFTGMTGGEMAKLLLESSWSNQPFDETSEQILSKLIPEAVTKRHRYPEFSWGRLEIVTHANAIHKQIQLQPSLDALSLITHQLLEDSQELAALHRVTPTKYPVPLATRWAYWKWRAHLSSFQLISSDLEVKLGVPQPADRKHPSSSPSTPQVLSFGKLARTCLARIGKICVGTDESLSGFADIEEATKSLSSFLFTSTCLQGASSKEVSPGSLVQWLAPDAESPRGYILTAISQLEVIRSSEDITLSQSQDNFHSFSLRLGYMGWRFGTNLNSSWEPCCVALLTLAAHIAFADWIDVNSLLTTLKTLPRHPSYPTPNDITCQTSKIRARANNYIGSDLTYEQAQQARQHIDALCDAVIKAEPAWEDQNRLLPCIQGGKHTFKFNSYSYYCCTQAALSSVQEYYDEIREAYQLTWFLSELQKHQRRILQTAAWIRGPKAELDGSLLGAALKYSSPWKPIDRKGDVFVPNAFYSEMGELRSEAQDLWRSNVSSDIQQKLTGCLRWEDLEKEAPTLPTELPLRFEDNVPSEMQCTQAYLGQVQGLKDSYKDHVRQVQAEGHRVCRLAPDASDILEKLLTQCQERAVLFEKECVRFFGAEEAAKTLPLSGLWAPLQPMTLFPLVSDSSTSPEARSLLAAQMIYRVYLNKIRRCLLLVDTAKKSAVSPGNASSADQETQAVRELQQVRSKEWSPSENPDWLVFEVEQGITIRDIQASLARNIMSQCEPQPSGSHSGFDPSTSYCLQLNMGEGKTSVILPIVCASLADGKEVVPRVTVLGSLFATNFELLSRSLSGLLQRRLYTFPCQRDLPQLNPEVFSVVNRQLQECLQRRGCIVTVPEHRLSFRLKLEENYGHVTQQPKMIQAMEKVEAWYENHALDILDESDELLRHKYQLIYPTGSQQAVDGSTRRWQIVQCVLRMTQKRAKEIEQRLGSSRLLHVPPQKPGRWPEKFRLIGASGDFDDIIVDGLFSGEELELGYLANIKGEPRRLLRDFVRLPEASELEATLSLPQLSGAHKADFLILRALLAYKVLDHVLRLRWFVEYGVQPGESPRRLMAVPFRAQGVASERTEFGHPDVAILATTLAYYNTGLNGQQVREAFNLLMSDNSKDSVYQEWVKGGNFSDALTTIGGVNLSDPASVRELITLFRANIHVINYWLNRVVFPKETKQFPMKLMASAWDLAPLTRFAVRGFSGTNDSRDLLPLNISQVDLPSVAATNGQVISNLLRPENNAYHSFSAAVCTGETILKEMIAARPGGRVLIDTGALMQDLRNDQVISTWLKLDNTALAGVYFSDNRLVVLTRLGLPTPFDLSSYRNQLDRCVVFLDDSHTRGTDLRFPIPTHAYVTLCSNMRKDKLVQGCMRMRQLGRGHTVSFWAPHEAHITIKPSDQKQMGANEILTWATINTVRTNIQATTAWVNQGFCDARKQAARSLLKEPKAEELKKHSEAHIKLIQFDEILSLHHLYSKKRVPKRLDAHLHEKIGAWIDKIDESTRSLAFGKQSQVLKIFKRETAQILLRCDEVVRDHTTIVQQLDEEQERELEQEQEQERDPERPQKLKPHKPTLHPGLLLAVKEAPNDDVSGYAIPIGESFDRTSLALMAKKHTLAWDPRLFVTREFTKAVIHQTKSTTNKEDEFQHIPNGVLVHWDEEGKGVKRVIVVSDFEADMLLPHLRKRCTDSQEAIAISFHHIVRRLFQDQPESLLTPLSLPSRVIDDSWRQDALRPLCAQLAVFTSSLYHSRQDRPYVLGFLGIIPPPGRDKDTDIDSEQWRKLQELNLLGSDGFVVKRDAGITSGTLAEQPIEVWTKISGKTQFQESPIKFLKELAALRNLLGRLMWSQVGSWVEVE